MRVAVDPCLIVSAFVHSENNVRKLLFSDFLEILVSEIPKKEIEDNKDFISVESSLDEEKVKKALAIIYRKLKVVNGNELLKVRAEAEALSPLKEYASLFATAIAEKAVIWSDNPGLKRQKEIKVLSTKELMIIEKIKRLTV